MALHHSPSLRVTVAFYGAALLGGAVGVVLERNDSQSPADHLSLLLVCSLTKLGCWSLRSSSNTQMAGAILRESDQKV